MKINNDYRVEGVSKDSVILIFPQKKTRKDGKDAGKEYIFENKWYYNNIQSAMQGYFLKTLDDSKDLKDCMELIKQSMAEIKKLSF